MPDHGPPDQPDDPGDRRLYCHRFHPRYLQGLIMIVFWILVGVAITLIVISVYNLHSLRKD